MLKSSGKLSVTEEIVAELNEEGGKRRKERGTKGGREGGREEYVLVQLCMKNKQIVGTNLGRGWRWVR